MILVKIAAYILLITLLAYFSSRILWLFFLLFSYRFWESVITIEFVNKILPNVNSTIYYIFIIALTVCVYLSILAFTREMPFIKYLLLFVVAIYVLRQPDYGLTDVFLFRDYLEANGMWSFSYWINQIKQLFVLEDNLIIETFKSVFKGFFNFMKSIFG